MRLIFSRGSSLATGLAGTGSATPSMARPDGKSAGFYFDRHRDGSKREGRCASGRFFCLQLCNVCCIDEE